MDIKRLKNFIGNHFLVYLDRLLKRDNIVNGLREKSSKQIVKDGDYILGMFGKDGGDDIKDDGNFEAFMPEGEQQNAGFERLWCVSENGLCNPIETIFTYFAHIVNSKEASPKIQELVKIFRHFGLYQGDVCKLCTEYVAVGAGTTKRGNGYANVADFIRHNGLIPKGSWPAYSTWNQLYYPADGTWINGNRVPQELLDRGRKLTEFVDITYYWVAPKKFKIDTYKKGAFGTSGYAWLYPDENGVYQNPGLPANHAFYTYKPPENVFFAGDSYEPFKKELALNYSLGNGMILCFDVKKPLGIYNEDKVKQFYLKKKYIQRTDTVGGGHGEVYQLFPDGTLKELSQQEKMEIGIQQLAIRGDMTGVNEEFFKSLFV